MDGTLFAHIVKMNVLTVHLCIVEQFYMDCKHVNAACVRHVFGMSISTAAACVSAPTVRSLVPDCVQAGMYPQTLEDHDSLQSLLRKRSAIFVNSVIFFLYW